MIAIEDNLKAFAPTAALVRGTHPSTTASITSRKLVNEARLIDFSTTSTFRCRAYNSSSTWRAGA